jgi:cytochrome c oxidase cbb3-type subunit 3
MSEKKPAQTTGHVWDDDLQELNNPLPAWWLWAFYLTILFSIIYWIIYPAWPVGKGFTTGIGKIEYINQEGQKKESHWNTRALLEKDMQAAREKQKPFFDKIAATPYEQIAKDTELSNFVASAGRVLFLENCAACHQSGGQGKVGFAPNLTDDDWMYGGTYDKIQETITNGRKGVMPAKGGANLSEAEVTQLANYVLSLSAIPVDAKKAKAGDVLFHGTGGCFGCHGPDGKGNQAIGSANLTDKIWLWADVPSQPTTEAKVEAVKHVIMTGLNKGVMPAWNLRLSNQQIRLLSAYVHDTLGGGKK